MEDKKIVELFLSRSERAIQEIAKKYEKYCYHIAYGILHNHEDAQECINDAYYQTWNSIPPQEPERLSTYVGKITRNLALNKWEYYNAKKRGMGEVPFVLEELRECIPNGDVTEDVVDQLYFEDMLNAFLSKQSKEKRVVFMRRYWYMSTIKEISKDFNMSESKIKMMLSRLRKELRAFLENEGRQL